MRVSLLLLLIGSLGCNALTGIDDYQACQDCTDGSAVEDGSDSIVADTSDADDAKDASDVVIVDTLDGGPCSSGIACGTCGVTTCTKGVSTCVEATPAPGTACGKCSTSKTACSSPGTTSCLLPDDRKIGTDISFKAGGTSDDVSHAREAMVEWKLSHAGSITSVTLWIVQAIYSCGIITTSVHPDPACSVCVADGGSWDCSVPSPTDGSLSVELYKGRVSDGTATKLGTASVASTGIPTFETSAGTTFTFAGVPELATGTTVSLLVNTDSTRYKFFVGTGNLGSAPATLQTSWHAIYPPGAWKADTLSTIRLTAQVNGCGF